MTTSNQAAAVVRTPVKSMSVFVKIIYEALLSFRDENNLCSSHTAEWEISQSQKNIVVSFNVNDENRYLWLEMDAEEEFSIEFPGKYTLMTMGAWGEGENILRTILEKCEHLGDSWINPNVSFDPWQKITSSDWSRPEEEQENQQAMIKIADVFFKNKE